MFEQPAGKEEKDRSRLIILLSGAAVVSVLCLILLSRACPVSKPEEFDMARGGTAEFDDYAPFIQITNISKSTAERLGNKVGIIRCRVQNTGDKTITGLQLRGVAWGDENGDLELEVLRENIVTPVPRIKEALAPNQTMPIDLFIEPLPDPSLVKEMTIEVYGLKLYQ